MPDSNGVDLKDPLKQFQGFVFDGNNLGDSGIVHEDVDSAMGSDRLSNHSFTILGDSHVCSNNRDPVAKICRQGFQSFTTPGGDDDRGAYRVEHSGHPVAEAGGRTGDDGNGAIEIEQREWIDRRGHRSSMAATGTGLQVAICASRDSPSTQIHPRPGRGGIGERIGSVAPIRSPSASPAAANTSPRLDRLITDVQWPNLDRSASP